VSREADNALAMQNAICRRLMQAFGLSEKHATDYAIQAMGALSGLCGGERVYIPKPGRDERVTGTQLKNAWDGTTACRDALCQEHSISISSFYRLLGEVKGG